MHADFDFSKCQAIQVRNLLFTVGFGSPMPVYRYKIDFNFPVKVEKVELASAVLGLSCFAMASYRNKFLYVTGGIDY